jgi:hypothetical protein
MTLVSSRSRFWERGRGVGPLLELLDAPTAGRLEAVDDASCILHTGSNSLTELAVYVALKGIDIEVLDPPELVEYIQELAARLQRAAPRTIRILSERRGGDAKPAPS